MPSDTVTLKELARRVSPTADAASIRFMINRLQHWVDRGLLAYVGLDPADQSVGRALDQGRIGATGIPMSWCLLVARTNGQAA